MVLGAHSAHQIPTASGGLTTGPRHKLGTHCRSTAEWAARFAAVFGAGELAYALGLFHDAGKAGRAWQQRLLVVEGTDNRVGLPHKELGARLILPTAGLAALAVLGHHGGLTSPQRLLAVLSEADSVDDDEIAARFYAEVPEAVGVRLRRGLFPQRWPRVADKQGWEMRLRMVFSALVDADHLDTAAHRHGSVGPRVAAAVDMGALAARFEQRRADLLAESATGEIAALREQVYQAAVAAAATGPGLFRLAAPTGLGKTFAQGAFALHHAARWGKARVIVAVPFITITEQNAAVYRTLLDDAEQPVVLEHHSSVRFDSDDDAQDSTDGRWARLASENWDAPFVVTTTVQLFESLFGRKPSQVRKVHRLAGAVVILDEVQALPPRLLLPILSGLRTLVEDFGTTVLLTSATQPEFQALSEWRSSQDREGVQITEIIADPQPLFVRARRVRYEWRLDPQPTWEEIADEIAAQPQALVIVNSVADARDLYQLLADRREDVWHLSTRLCPQHRRLVLDTVTTRLRDGAPTVVVSTQLVEAGVDLSFPVVWRALAPADSLQQAGGRSNRHGECAESGLVVVFDPVDGCSPTDYRRPCDLTVKHFGPDGPPLDDQQALARYYRELYSDLQLDHRPLDQTKWSAGQWVQHNRSNLDFHSVTDGPLLDSNGTTKRDPRKAFRMIEDDTAPVVITESSNNIEPLLADLAAGTIRAGSALRRLQPWIVQLRTNTANRPDVAALLTPVAGDLARWDGVYDWDPATCRGVGLDEGAFDSVF
ncbi:CRISPR-associated helicase Cas3' [Nocardia panacis]|uniref:CRISPR-associated helicase Cas3 n=1 Tax=Nocardia panacis TaxID=2340916 RepID=A0A3A4K0S9_9NOCA|nr:CRISPR-associated helicase Cas3' [Nocardia panacis]RJO77683.1 CRISPR-associated helicase Cas3' [Nocardia panacis]